MTRWILLFVSLTALIAGCGKDLNLAIKAAEAEKDQPSAALVRKVEVSYHDPVGKEQMRESVAVLGLSQPVSMSADLMKSLSVEKDGVFEARGYTGDGQLLLRGLTRIESDEGESIEVVLSREASQATVLDSPLLRRVRLVDAQISGDFIRESRELQKEAEKGRCLELPAMKMNPSAGRMPKIILEGSIKAPAFSVEIGERVGGRGDFKALSGLLPLEINPAGDAEFELGRRFLDGALFKGPAKLMLKIHSSRYEGCLELNSMPDVPPPAPMQPVSTACRLDGGVGKGLFMGRSLSSVLFRNDNKASVTVRIHGSATRQGERLRACYNRSNDAIAIERLTCVDTISDTIEVLAGQTRSLSVFLGIDKKTEHHVSGDFRIDWNVLTTGSSGEQVSNPVTCLVP